MSDERILNHLTALDHEALTAVVSALEAAAFLTSLLHGPDNHSSIHISSGKPESKVPGNPQMVGAYDSMIRRFAGISALAEKVALQLDEQRGPERVWIPPEDTPAEAGRPCELTAEQVAKIRELAERGLRPTQIAMWGVIPRATFWRLLKEGRHGEGLKHDLYVAVYEGGHDGRPQA